MAPHTFRYSPRGKRAAIALLLRIPLESRNELGIRSEESQLIRGAPCMWIWAEVFGAIFPHGAGDENPRNIIFDRQCEIREGFIVSENDVVLRSFLLNPSEFQLRDSTSFPTIVHSTRLASQTIRRTFSSRLLWKYVLSRDRRFLAFPT